MGGGAIVIGPEKPEGEYQRHKEGIGDENIQEVGWNLHVAEEANLAPCRSHDICQVPLAHPAVEEDECRGDDGQEHGRQGNDSPGKYSLDRYCWARRRIASLFFEQLEALLHFVQTLLQYQVFLEQGGIRLWGTGAWFILAHRHHFTANAIFTFMNPNRNPLTARVTWGMLELRPGGTGAAETPEPRQV